MNSSAQQIGSFFALLMLQVLVLNHILLFGFINPFVYIAFVFLFPLKENRFQILTFSFLLGLCIDFFTDTGGIHAFATLFIAFVRPIFIRLIFRKDVADIQAFRLKVEPFGKVFNYVIVLTLIHHLIYFSFANFSFHNFDKVILNTIYSTIFTVILFFVGNYIFMKEA